MPVITVRATDSAAAMDEVIRRLGPDALILSTRSREGQVEIVATDEEAPAPQKDAPTPPDAPTATEAAQGWAAGFAAHLSQAMGDAPRAPITRAASHPPQGLSFGDHASFLDAPRLVLVGPVGAGKSGLALQIAHARLDAAEARGDEIATPLFVHCGTGSHSDGGYLSQKSWLIGAEMVFAGPDALPDPGAGRDRLRQQVVVLSGLHPDPLAAARAFSAAPGTICLFVLPAGLRAARIADLLAPWQGFVQGVVLTLAPDEAASPDDIAPLAQAGLAIPWTSRRGRMVGGLTVPDLAPPAAAPPSARRPRGPAKTAKAKISPKIQTLAAG